MTMQSLLGRFAALNAKTKLGLALAAFVVFVAMLIGGIALHPVRAPLFAQALHPDQVTEVEEQLAAWNVAFTPVADNVVVDAGRRNDILLRLSLAGVPHEHVATTNEVLANVGVLTPQAVVDAQTRTGLAGEIELALRSVDGVDDARVIIAPAKLAEFADQHASPASASVRLHLHSGLQLSSSAVEGIRSFVAASVEGLDAAHVTLLDDRGVAVSATPERSDDEEEVAKSLQSALDQSLGSGVAIVRIHTERASAEREARTVRRTPLGPVARESSTESFDGQGRRYEKNDERDDRGSDTHEDVIRVPAGSVTRMSTAVFVDASRNVNIESVRELAAATVGFDPKRGDTLTVQAVDFNRGRAPKRDGWFLLYGALVPLLPTCAIVAGLLVALRSVAPHIFALSKQYVARASIAQNVARVSGISPAQVRGALAHEPPHAAAAIISALPAATAAAVLELYPQQEREAIVRRMQRAHSPLIPNADELLERYA